MKRRHFLKSTSSAVSAAAVSSPLWAAENSEVIYDIHQHINFHGRRNGELIAHQKMMGVTKTVLLPSGAQLARDSTHGGRSNGLAARIFGTAAAVRLAGEHPKSFVYFCNEIPDLDSTKASLEKWLEGGAIGIGEQKFNLDCDSKPMQQVYEIANAFEVPVLLHFQHGSYNLGFERFHKMLEKYPKVNFFGHAQTWWGNIDAKLDQKDLYPKGKVTSGGLTDKYLADYPNMFGDLSAGSGLNSMKRDEEHAAAFLDRHQDKLCLGTDCADAIGEGTKCSGSGMIDLVRRLVPDDTARAKIFSGNAKRVIPFGD